jgi:hypothetical protein
MQDASKDLGYMRRDIRQICLLAFKNGKLDGKRRRIVNF